MLLTGKHLNGAQKEQFRKALHDAFHYESLERMLSDNLDFTLEKITPRNSPDFPSTVDAVIKRAEEESWTAQLLQAALSKRSEDIQLIEFAQQFGLAITTPPLKNLVAQHARFERAITSAPMHEYDAFLWGLWEHGSQVCRVEDACQAHLGTGFLVGPDMIVTCYHVWEAAQSPDNFICRFDQEPSSKNTTHRLAEQGYKIDMSQYNLEEGQSGGKASSPDELDYALLRLADAPGEELIHRPFQEHPTQRGWITPYSQEYTFPKDSSLYILHYPQILNYSQEPSPITLKVSLEDCAIIESNEMRVRYTTNTANGSSGAPCFTANWELVALHHLGDPNDQPKFNQGIPFMAIKKRVEQNCHKGIFMPFLNNPFLRKSNTNEHEASESTRPTAASPSQNQASSPSKKQPLPSSLEPIVPRPLSTNRKRAKPKSAKGETPIDRNELFDLLNASVSGAFSKIVTYSGIPDDILPGIQASQSERASALLKWAEGKEGPGLSILYEHYLRANGIKRPNTTIERPLEEEKLNNITNINEARIQHEAGKAMPSLSFLEQAYKYLGQAQKSAEAAYTPFAEGKRPDDEEFTYSIDALKKANQSIQSLRTLLSSDSSLIPGTLLKNRTRINGYINTTIEQIEKRLIPSLSFYEIRDFSPLQTALQNIAGLLPKQTKQGNS